MRITCLYGLSVVTCVRISEWWVRCYLYRRCQYVFKFSCFERCYWL